MNPHRSLLWSGVRLTDVKIASLSSTSSVCTAKPFFSSINEISPAWDIKPETLTLFEEHQRYAIPRVSITRWIAKWAQCEIARAFACSDQININNLDSNTSIITAITISPKGKQEHESRYRVSHIARGYYMIAPNGLVVKRRTSNERQRHPSATLPSGMR